MSKSGFVLLCGLTSGYGYSRQTKVVQQGSAETVSLLSYKRSIFVMHCSAASRVCTRVCRGERLIRTWIFVYDKISVASSAFSCIHLPTAHKAVNAQMCRFETGVAYWRLHVTTADP